MKPENDPSSSIAKPDVDHAASASDKEIMTPHSGDDREAAEELGEYEERPADSLESPRPWRTAESLKTLKSQVNQAAPNRDKSNDGTIGDAAHQSRASDHNPWVTDGNTGVVTAMDITNDPAHHCSAETLAEAIRGSRDARVKYLIWNRRICNASPIGQAAAWQWRPYNGQNPHTHHVHISVKSDKAHYDSTAAWTIA